MERSRLIPSVLVGIVNAFPGLFDQPSAPTGKAKQTRKALECYCLATLPRLTEKAKSCFRVLPAMKAKRKEGTENATNTNTNTNTNSPPDRRNGYNKPRHDQHENARPRDRLTAKSVFDYYIVCVSPLQIECRLYAIKQSARKEGRKEGRTAQAEQRSRRAGEQESRNEERTTSSTRTPEQQPRQRDSPTA